VLLEFGIGIRKETQDKCSNLFAIRERERERERERSEMYLTENAKRRKCDVRARRSIMGKLLILAYWGLG
jgi:hypothetical protein